MVLELAFVLPVLLLALMGMWDFGRALQANNRLIAAARAGMQYGMRDAATALDSTGIARAVRADAEDTQNRLSVSSSRSCECPNGAAVTCGAACPGGGEPRVFVEINVGDGFVPTFPYPMIARPFPLSTQVRARVQ